VEDDPITRGYQTDALRQDGFYVLDVSDAVSALEMLRHGKPDLIITDLMLPSMQGETFLFRPEVKGIPVLVTTAKVLPGTMPPDTEILPKPFTIDELLVRVRRRRKEFLENLQ
jgi:DNA-binding response OmpR family regulator